MESVNWTVSSQAREQGDEVEIHALLNYVGKVYFPAVLDRALCADGKGAGTLACAGVPAA